MQHPYALYGALTLGVVALMVYSTYRMRQRHVEPVHVGDVAPDFTLLDETGVARKLSDYRGSKVVLYFYPKDETPGCTAQACGLRDSYAVYRDHDITILGVSYDSPESHKQFKEHHQLPFTLLSDTRREVAKKYGAYQSVINRVVPERMTFLINEQGKIVHVMRDIQIATHAAEILKLFGI